MNVANLISLARLLAVPLMIYLILQDAMAFAFWLFVVAGVSDAVDGFLARHLGQASELGAHLDPLADKVLLVGVYVTLGYLDHLPTWLVILVVFRDFLIIGGVTFSRLFGEPLKLRPLYISKVNTAGQIGLVATILAGLGHGIEVMLVVDMLIYLVAATTLLSGAGYVVTWARQVARIEGPR